MCPITTRREEACPDCKGKKPEEKKKCKKCGGKGYYLHVEIMPDLDAPIEAKKK